MSSVLSTPTLDADLTAPAPVPDEASPSFGWYRAHEGSAQAIRIRKLVEITDRIGHTDVVIRVPKSPYGEFEHQWDLHRTMCYFVNRESHGISMSPNADGSLGSTFAIPQASLRKFANDLSRYADDKRMLSAMLNDHYHRNEVNDAETIMQDLKARNIRAPYQAELAGVIPEGRNLPPSYLYKHLPKDHETGLTARASADLIQDLVGSISSRDKAFGMRMAARELNTALLAVFPVVYQTRPQYCGHNFITRAQVHQVGSAYVHVDTRVNPSNHRPIESTLHDRSAYLRLSHAIVASRLSRMAVADVGAAEDSYVVQDEL